MNDELYHYGVKGMRWGTTRATVKVYRNKHLRRKAATLDKKAAIKRLESERAHYKYDLGMSARKAGAAEKYRIKAAKHDKKANSYIRSTRLKEYHEKRAASNKYKAAKRQITANRIAKTTGYGPISMNLSIKADKLNKRAERCKRRVTRNDVYIRRMQRKVSTLSKSEMEAGKKYIDAIMNGTV